MQRSMIVARLFATLGLTLWLIGAATFQAAAQGNETGAAQTDVATPTGGNETGGNATGNSTGGTASHPPATGTLTVLAYRCTTGGDAGTGAIFPAGGFTPDGSCTKNTATVTIDGGAATKVKGSADFSLDTGTHAIADTATGATLDVNVAAGGTTTVSDVAYTAAEQAATPMSTSPTGSQQQATSKQAPVSTTIHLIKHDCAPSIQTAADFAALDDNGKLTACPVITREGNNGPDGAVNGGHAGFDFSFAVAGGETLTLAGNATFTPAQVCEADLGTDVDGDGNLNTCFDASDYAVTVSGGPVTITETKVPVKHRFGAVVLPDAQDAAALDAKSVDVAAGTFVVDPSLDTSGDGKLVIHVYNFASPRVSVVVHNCPDTIKKTADFNALGDFAGKLKGCPAIAAADYAGVGITVTGNDSQAQTLADATLVDKLVCESDPANLCLAGYAFDGVQQGNVTVTETPPADHKLGWAIAGPVSATGNPTPIKLKVKSGVASLATTEYGDVTVHLFNLLSAAGNNQGGNGTGGGNDSGGNTTGGNNSDGNTTGANNSDGNTTSGNSTGGNDTGGNTSGSNNTGGNTTGGGQGNGDGSGVGGTGGGTGSLAVYTLYCLTSSQSTDIKVFAPGQQVDPHSLGDDTCIEDTNEYQISEFGRNDLAPFQVDSTGFAQIDGLPATDGQSHHLISDTFSGTSAPFTIAPGKTTEVVVLIWEADTSSGVSSGDSTGGYSTDPSVTDPSVTDPSAVDPYATDGLVDPSLDNAGDVSAVDSGQGLPDTGVGPISRPNDDMVLLLGLAGFFVLGGAYRLRRIPGRYPAVTRDGGPASSPGPRRFSFNARGNRRDQTSRSSKLVPRSSYLEARTPYSCTQTIVPNGAQP